MCARAMGVLLVRAIRYTTCFFNQTVGQCEFITHVMDTSASFLNLHTMFFLQTSFHLLLFTLLTALKCDQISKEYTVYLYSFGVKMHT